ncbi:hypothetical protein E2C01_012619 [Portunus trituberculatus]|uniref:Uncharacterized protein n=1 Tax=Portunus trituberculatus TaxID=210409 RepID=A0A5B7DEL7_PORTR|nr:hypothetical protein [Portunus trituberculatus]
MKTKANPQHNTHHTRYTTRLTSQHEHFGDSEYINPFSTMTHFHINPFFHYLVI